MKVMTQEVMGLYPFLIFAHCYHLLSSLKSYLFVAFRPDSPIQGVGTSDDSPTNATSTYVINFQLGWNFFAIDSHIKHILKCFKLRRSSIQSGRSSGTKRLKVFDHPKIDEFVTHRLHPYKIYLIMFWVTIGSFLSLYNLVSIMLSSFKASNSHKSFSQK
jgi:hypothetical protein